MNNLAHITLLALDFDGVMTDNSVYIFEDGTEAVQCSRADGEGIKLLKAAGIEVIVITAETRSVFAEKRCAKLGIQCLVSQNKLASLKEFIGYRIAFGQVVYIGNDLSDLECLRAVGHPAIPWDVEPSLTKALGPLFCPKDRHTLCSHGARVAYMIQRQGGRGAVREVCDMILEAKLVVA